MRIYNTIVFVFLFIVPIKHGFLLAQEDWTLRKQKDGITIYTREREGNPLKEYRFSATIETPINVVYKFLSDVKLHPEWVYQCAGLTIIDEEPDIFVTYHTLYDIPWPAADRDLVARAVIQWADDSARVRILTEEIDQEYDLEKGIVRMPDYKEDVVLERIDERNTLFRTEGYADPGGRIPPWLTNMFLVEGIYDCVITTREQTEKR
jgi:hypothetical protein